MKYLGLFWCNLKRKKLRTLFTFLSVMIAFLLFGVLAAVKNSFTVGVDLAGADRLVTRSSVSIIQMLPESYGNRISQIDGVKSVSHSTWLGGYFQETRNSFGTFAIDAETFVPMNEVILLSPDRLQAFYKNRTGAMVGTVLADRFGWKIGDRVPLRSSIWRKADGSDTWEVTVEAIYKVPEGEGTGQSFFIHYDYFDETRPEGSKGLVGWYSIQVADPDRAPEIATAVDALFENSPAETKTSLESAWAQSFANQIGDIGAITIAVVSAVFFTMLLIVANTMMQAFRERTAELGVLKTLGFSNTQVMALVLAESVLVTFLGGVLGLALGWLLVKGIAPAVKEFLPIFLVPDRDLFIGLGITVALGLIAGILPASQALRLRIVDALRRV